MTRTSQQIRFFRSRIPTFECEPGCHDCCGPVTCSSEEIARLPVKSDAEHAAALAEYNCVYRGANGCTVYAERPLVCRLFGTTPKLACPRGKRPQQMIDSDTEQQVFAFFKSQRQVLL